MAEQQTVDKLLLHRKELTTRSKNLKTQIAAIETELAVIDLLLKNQAAMRGEELDDGRTA